VSILDANDRIRQQVAAEERAKWEAEKQSFLSRELDAERLRLNEAKVRARGWGGVGPSRPSRGSGGGAEGVWHVRMRVCVCVCVCVCAG
jgi:hypothetical protein